MRKTAITIIIALATLATSYGQAEQETKKPVNATVNFYSPLTTEVIDLYLSGEASEEFINSRYDLYITTVDRDQDVYRLVSSPGAIYDTLDTYDNHLGVTAQVLKDYLLDDSEHEKVFIVPTRPPR